MVGWIICTVYVYGSLCSAPSFLCLPKNIQGAVKALGLVSDDMLLGDCIGGNEIWLLSESEGQTDSNKHQDVSHLASFCLNRTHWDTPWQRHVCFEKPSYPLEMAQKNI